MSRLQLEVALDLAAIEAAQDGIAAWLEEGGASAPLAYRARLVIEELLANLVMHGRFAGPPPPARLDLTLDDNILVLVIEDAAAPFDPRTEITRDAEAIGGLGLKLVRQMAEIRAYQRTEEGWNRTALELSGESRQQG